MFSLICFVVPFSVCIMFSVSFICFQFLLKKKITRFNTHIYACVCMSVHAHTHMDMYTCVCIYSFVDL